MVDNWLGHFFSQVYMPTATNVRCHHSCPRSSEGCDDYITSRKAATGFRPQVQRTITSTRNKAVVSFTRWSSNVKAFPRVIIHAHVAPRDATTTSPRERLLLGSDHKSTGLSASWSTTPELIIPWLLNVLPSHRRQQNIMMRNT